MKYFFVSFVDLFGVLRSKLVPATAIDEIQSEGAGFAGFATWLDMSPADSDMFGMPDGDSVIQLPWNKEIAWVASDLYMDGKPVEASPRIALKRQIEKASKWFNKYGKWSLLFAWVPIVGDPLTYIAGTMKMRFSIFILLVSIGKIGRYLFISLLI